MTLKERERQVALQEKRWSKEKGLIEREETIKAEKKSLREKFKEKKERAFVPNSKLLIWFLFINCTIIEIFTIIVIFKELHLAEQGLMSPDLSPLMALISTVVAEVIGFAVYALKSAKENTEGGIVYETAMKKLEQEEENCG